MLDGDHQLEFVNLVRLLELVAILLVGILVGRLGSFGIGRGRIGGLLRGLCLMELGVGGGGGVGAWVLVLADLI